MPELMSDTDVIQRVLDHADAKTTDLGDEVWREPVENYRSQDRLDAELELFRRLPMIYCPSAAVRENGTYVARSFLGIPVVVVRGDDGVVRGFYNSCRHRGMMLVEGSGSARSFVCPYHAWVYGLTGELKRVAGPHGFPDLDQAQHGLVQIPTEERNGFVFVTLAEPVSNGALASFPDLVQPDQQIFEYVTFDDEANWKVLLETAMEGYHIKALHRTTFYPYGFDNLNVVETYGPNARVVFPFRRIEKLRDIPADERRAPGMLTYVYQLFPNTRVSVLSNHYQVVITEPLTTGSSRWHVYRLTPPGANLDEAELERSKRDAAFVKDTGVIEDRAAACAIQKNLAGEGNTHFTFGRFEQGAVHFHRNLNTHLDELSRQR